MPEHLTQQEIMDLLSEYRRTVYGTMHRDMRDDQRVIHASAGWGRSIMPKYLKGFPTGFTPNVPPLAKKGVEIAVTNTVIGEKPGVKYSLLPGEKVTVERERKREVTENLYNAILQNIADRTTVNPFKEMAWNQHGLGGCALSFPFRWDLWKQLQKAIQEDDEGVDRLKRNLWMWDVQATSPLIIVHDPDHDPPEHYIRFDKISGRMAKSLYPEKKDLFTEKNSRVDRVIYLDEQQYTVIIGGQGVVDGDNPCGMLWHEWLWGGYGHMDDERNFEHLGKGLIRDAKDVLIMLIRAINRNEAIQDVAAFSPVWIRAETEELADHYGDKLEFGPNKIMATGREVDKIEFLRQPEVSQATQWTYEVTVKWLEIVFGPSIFGGAYPETTASGMRQRVNLAQTPFQPAKVAGEQAIANMLRKMGSFIKRELGEHYFIPTSKSGTILDVDPDDILEDGIIEVDCAPPSPEDMALQQEKDMREMESGGISRQEYRRRHNITDGEKQDTDRAFEMIQFHPSMVEAAVMVARQRLLTQIAPELAAAATETVPAQEPMSTPGPGMPATDGRMPTPQEGVQRDARALFGMPRGA